MATERVALWERIAAFDIDGDAAPALPFAGRLARENSWTRPFAARGPGIQAVRPPGDDGRPARSTNPEGGRAPGEPVAA